MWYRNRYLLATRIDTGRGFPVSVDVEQRQFLKLEMYCSDDTLYRPTYKSGHNYMRERQLITQNTRYSINGPLGRGD